MAVEQRLERPYRVRFDEAGGDGALRSSGYLRFAQDLAWIHSESVGFGREWYGERGLTWLVRGVELDIVDDLEYGGEVVVSTEVVGFRRVVARRRSEFHRAGSERAIAVAITDWVLLNASGRPVRPPTEILDVFTATPDAFTPLRVHLDSSPAEVTRGEFAVRRSEADPMEHVNNAAYIDYVDESFIAQARGSRPPLPRRYRAEFVGSAVAGTILVATSWPGTLAWSYRLQDREGREVLRAIVESDPATGVGG